MNKIILIPLFISFACQQSGRVPTDVDAKKFKNTSDFLLKRAAFEFKGSFKGIKEKGKHKEFKVTECNFSYEKAKDVEHKSEKEYMFERFSVSYEGIDKGGESSFDSVSYMNSNYLNDFIAFDFSKSFGPVPLNSVIKYGSQEKDATIKFVRGAGKSAVMQFKHTDAFGTDVSKFFDYGEKRNYTVRIFFDEYSKKNISLGKVSVLIESQKMDKFGKHKAPVTVADIKCSSFKPLPDM